MLKQKNKPPIVLLILDGWGVAPRSPYNAITLANTPVFDELVRRYPHTNLGASGEDVGLDDDQLSGSEAGHMNIGAGRVVFQDSHFITKSINDGSFFKNPALTGSVKHVKKTAGKFHLMGIMGDTDSPHGSPYHFRAVLRLAKESGVSQVYCHLFTDGRDSYPKSALEHLANFRQIMAEEGIGKIATLSGRYWAMDRSKNWKLLTRAYDAIVFSRGHSSRTAEKAIEQSYSMGITDQFLEPTVIMENGRPVAKIEEGDSVVFFNFRSDRARQLAKLFAAENKERVIIDDMPALDHIQDLYFVAMTDFGPDLDLHTAFSGKTIRNALPLVLEKRKQLYISEREKFAHVTYFINGGFADPLNGEERIMIESVKNDYDNVPEMSAKEINDHVLDSIWKNKHDMIVMNFANADMVGHTGNLVATVRAVEFLDRQLGRLASLVLKKKGTLIVTADHGNADQMYDPVRRQAHTFHTKNPVPFILVDDGLKNKKLGMGGVLGNIAPTLLDVAEVGKPKEMSCESLMR